jgi:hypothetical protein
MHMPESKSQEYRSTATKIEEYKDKLDAK